MVMRLRSAMVVLLIMILLTGVIYPLAVTGLAQLFFPFQANGSLVEVDGQVVGSVLIGQDFNTEQYFWPRPSAVGYNPMPSSGSNLGPTSQWLLERVRQQERALHLLYGLPADADLPSDLLFASGSGLDPQISPEAALLQVARVAQARKLPVDQVMALVEQYMEPRQFGFFGEPRVNVLLFNIALDGLK